MNTLVAYDYSQTESPQKRVKKLFVLKVKVHNEPGMKDGFKSYEDYLWHYNSGDKRGKTLLYAKIENLRHNLEHIYGFYIDPIVYLANLYYGEKLSIIDTHKRVKDLGMNNSNKNSLEKTFKFTFGWELRDASGSEVTRKKCKGNIDNAKKTYKKDVEKKYENIKKYVSDNVYKILSRKNTVFDRNHYLGLDNNSQRMFYLIKTFLGLKKEDIIEINKLGPGARIIANYLNKRLKLYIKNYDLKLNIFPKYIQAILNEEKK